MPEAGEHHSDASLVGGGVCGDNVGAETTAGLDPARAVGGRGIAALLHEIGNGEANRAQRHDGKEDCQQTGLGAASHGYTLGYLRNCLPRVEQLKCQRQDKTDKGFTRNLCRLVMQKFIVNYGFRNAWANAFSS